MVSSTSLEAAAPAQYQMVGYEAGCDTPCSKHSTSSEAASSQSSGSGFAASRSPETETFSNSRAVSALSEAGEESDSSSIVPIRRCHSEPDFSSCRLPVSPGVNFVTTFPGDEAAPGSPFVRTPTLSGAATPTIHWAYTNSQFNDMSSQEWPSAQGVHPWQFPPMMMVPFTMADDSDMNLPALGDGEIERCEDALVSEVHQELPRQPFDKKELMKLRKKLREIAKIEERVAAGESIDPLQKVKLEKKHDVMAEVANAEMFKKAERGQQEAVTVQTYADQDGEPPGEQLQQIHLEPDQLCFVSMEGMEHMPMPWTHLTLTHPEEGVSLSGEDLLLEHQQIVPQQENHVYDLIEQAQMQAEMRAAQELQTWPPEEITQSITASRRRRRGHRGRMGPMPKLTPVELTEGLQGDDDKRVEALSAMQGSVLRLALEAAGCRVVQLALEVAEPPIVSQLLLELQGHVREAIESPHGNYVIQKIVEVLPFAQASFVAEELHGVGAMVARHRYGCRILCRLLEQAAHEPSAVLLMDELLAEADDLCRHNFGHHVIQCMLEHSPPAQQRPIIAALCSDLPRNVWNRNASFVIEKALTYCLPEEQRVLLEQLLSNPDMLTQLAQSRLAPHIAKAVSQLSGDAPFKLLSDLRLATGRLQGTRHGKRFLKDCHSAMTPVMAAA